MNRDETSKCSFVIFLRVLNMIDNFLSLMLVFGNSLKKPLNVVKNDPYDKKNQCCWNIGVCIVYMTHCTYFKFAVNFVLEMAFRYQAIQRKRYFDILFLF